VSKKSLLLVVLIGLAGALTFSVTGQEEPSQPLPIVQAKVTTFGLVDPTLEFQWPTLADAARRHDYVSFNTVYLEAKARGESVAEYDALYDLWTWSMNDPIGAFFGSDIRDRIARAYPGFADYIAEFAIVDSRGNTFYPTSETRAFLLEKALSGAPAPRLNIEERRVATREAQPTTRRSATPSPRAAERSDSKPAATAPAPTKVATPAVETPAPAPAQAAAPPAPAPVVAEPPVVVKVEEPAPAPTPAPAPAQTAVPETSGLRSRGLLLLVIGLIGIGLLALILRTPKEAVPTTILASNAAGANKPPAPVEPIRRTPAPDSPKGAEKPRATGSHG
jgi:hypothetical protein